MKILYAILLLPISFASLASPEEKISDMVDVMDKISTRYYVIADSYRTRKEDNIARFFYRNKFFRIKFISDLNKDLKKLEIATKISRYIYLNELDEEAINSGCDFYHLSYYVSYYIRYFEKIKECLSVDCQDIDIFVGSISSTINNNRGIFSECRSIQK